MICPECGVVHLSLQSISLRLDLNAFAELSKMVAQAQTTIEQVQRSTHEQKSHEAPHIFH
ncbi:hypothetical protein GCM10011282_30420 [Undibacterium macrobrachii]|uniref:Uncharacterized protein n=2 Tax=Undibacterium macrobrachii TaxID=1119058 RepID=A0ABQ2XL72_9BURK|nr:hypothetical protein GCM10011282_30420 [Undibacterium macrobrachii]